MSGYFEYMYLFLLTIFVHEYGHTVQSKIYGVSYFVPAFFSLWSSIFDTYEENSRYWTETDANAYSRDYFKTHYPSYAFPASLITTY